MKKGSRMTQASQAGIRSLHRKQHDLEMTVTVLWATTSLPRGSTSTGIPEGVHLPRPPTHSLPALGVLLGSGRPVLVLDYSQQGRHKQCVSQL